MSVCRTSVKRLLALSTKCSVGSERVLSSHAVLDHNFANGVSSSPYGYQRQSRVISEKHQQCVLKLISAVVRGYSTNRDDEGSQASEKPESRESSAHKGTAASIDDPVERKDSLCDGSPDHKASKSSGQPQHDAQHDAQQDAPAQQEHGQPPSTDEAAENRQPEQQQQSDTDASAIDRVCCSFFQCAGILF